MTISNGLTVIAFDKHTDTAETIHLAIRYLQSEMVKGTIGCKVWPTNVLWPIRCSLMFVVYTVKPRYIMCSCVCIQSSAVPAVGSRFREV